MKIGDRTTTPDGDGVIVDHDWCDGDTGVGINPAWVHNSFAVDLDDGDSEWFDVDDCKPIREPVSAIGHPDDVSELMAALEKSIITSHEARRKS
jgi:hypothetical protein